MLIKETSKEQRVYNIKLYTDLLMYYNNNIE